MLNIMEFYNHGYYFQNKNEYKITQFKYKTIGTRL